MHLSNPFFFYSWASLVAQMVKNLPAMQETQVRPPDQKDPLEKGLANILAWRIPWAEEPEVTVYAIAKDQTRLSN